MRAVGLFIVGLLDCIRCLEVDSGRLRMYVYSGIKTV